MRIRGRIVKIPAFEKRVTLKVEGPPNSLLKEHPFTSIDLVVDVDPQSPAARLNSRPSTGNCAAG